MLRVVIKMVKRSRLKKKRKDYIPVIVKELNEVSSEEVTKALMKHGKVMIKDPRWDEAVRKHERKIKKKK